MKSKLFRAATFVVLVACTDLIAGTVCRKLFNRSNDFYISKLRYTVESTNEDVLIFGNSRAEYHFVPGIIGDTLGMKVYNCGIGGADLLFSDMQLNESLKRYKPQYVIVEVSPNSFFMPDAEDHRKMLLPFYKRDTMIYNTLARKQPFEKIKFISSVYPYNSSIVPLLKGVFKKNTDTLCGFKAIFGELDTSGIEKEVERSFPVTNLPAENFSYLNQLITRCRKQDIRVVVVCSPIYKANGIYKRMVDEIKAFCSKYENLHFFDYSMHEQLYQKRNLFRDNTHLNYEGAMLFSGIFARDLNKIVGRKANDTVPVNMVSVSSRQ